MSNKGLLMVFTGDGKGKTTAALGLALRSAGHGHKVCFLQFIKGSGVYGERDAIQKHSAEIDFHVMGNGFTWRSETRAQDTETARHAWEFARLAMASGRYRLVVLDELTYLMAYGMIDLQEVVATLAGRPPDLHVAVTGRGAPPALLAIADLVTEMRAIKHPYTSGILAQPGIEY